MENLDSAYLHEALVVGHPIMVADSLRALAQVRGLDHVAKTARDYLEILPNLDADMQRKAVAILIGGVQRQLGLDASG